MKIDHNSKLSQEIETMRNSIVDINSQYTHQQLEIYGYNPNKHWTILNQYEDAAGKVPTTITGMLKNRDLLNEERRLAKELEPYNNFVFSYRESNSLPAENIGKEPIPQVQSNSFLNDCYRVLKKLPKAIKKNPRTSATVAGTVVAVPLILNAGPLVNCVSHGGYEMQKSLDDIKLPELVGVANAKPVKELLENPVTDFDKEHLDFFESEYNYMIKNKEDVFNLDRLDDTLFFFNCPTYRLKFINYHSFKPLSKSINEPIKFPDEITEQMYNSAKDEPGLFFYGQTNAIGWNKDTTYSPIKVSKSDLATWMAVASEETVAVCPYVACVDTDGNEKPDTLFAMYLGQIEDGKLISCVGVPKEFYDLDGKKIDFKGDPDYLINPFDTLGSDYSNIQNLLYFKDPFMINFGDRPTAIYWKDAIGKTPKELGLDKYDKPTTSEKRAYKAKQDEKLYEQLVEQGIGEELAEKMVKDMRTDTATEKNKTNPLVYIVPAGLGAAGIAYFATRKKSG